MAVPLRKLGIFEGAVKDKEHAGDGSGGTLERLSRDVNLSLSCLEGEADEAGASAKEACSVYGENGRAISGPSLDSTMRKEIVLGDDVPNTSDFLLLQFWRLECLLNGNTSRPSLRFIDGREKRRRSGVFVLTFEGTAGSANEGGPVA